MELAPIFTAHTDNRFIVLGRPGQDCPFLGWELGRQGYLATCTVHKVRPYACRRFKCYRPNPHTEPYETEPVDETNRRLGCANLSDRLVDRRVRRDYALTQRKSQKWAVRHGWPQDLAPVPVGSNVVLYRSSKEIAPHPAPR